MLHMSSPSPDPVIIRFHRHGPNRSTGYLASHTPLPFGWVDYRLRRGRETVVTLEDTREELLRCPLSLADTQRVLVQLIAACSHAYLAGHGDARMEE